MSDYQIRKKDFERVSQDNTYVAKNHQEKTFLKVLPEYDELLKKEEVLSPEERWENIKEKQSDTDQRGLMVAKQCIYDPELIIIALEDTWWISRDNLASAILKNLDAIAVMILPNHIKKKLRSEIDDWWVGQFDRKMLQRLDEQGNNIQADLVMSLNELYQLAQLLKFHIDEPKDNKDKIISLVNKCKNDKKTLDVLNIIYEGDLWHDLKFVGNAAELITLSDSGEGVEQLKGNIPEDFLLLDRNKGIQDYKFKLPAGGSIWTIARRFHTTVKEIAEENGWKLEKDGTFKDAAGKKVVITAGQTIDLPDTGLKINPGETVYVLENGEVVQKLKKNNAPQKITPKSIEYNAFKLYKEIASDLTSGFSKLIDYLKLLENDYVNVRLFLGFYATASQSNLISHIRSKVAEKSRHTRIIQRRMNRVILPQLNPFITNLVVDLETAKHFRNIQHQMGKTTQVRKELWKGFTMEKIVKKTRDELKKYKSKKSADSQNILGALMALQRNQPLIDDFFDEYGQENFDQDMINSRKSIPIDYGNTPMISGGFGAPTPMYNHYFKPVNDGLADSIYQLLESKTERIHADGMVDVSHHFNLSLDQIEDRRFKSFAQGSLIKFHESPQEEVEYFYTVKEDESPLIIAKKFNISLQELMELNNWDSIAPNGVIKAGGKDIHLQPHQGVIVPNFEKTENHHYICGPKVWEINASGFRISDGGTWQINAENYNPEYLDRLLHEILNGDIGGTTISFTLEVYVIGDLLFTIYCKVGLGFNLEVGVGDDLGIMTSMALKVNAKVGIAGNELSDNTSGSIQGSHNLFSQNIAYDNTKHFTTHLNHWIYKFFLEHNIVSEKFMEYWSNEENQKYTYIGGKRVRSVGSGGINDRNKEKEINDRHSTKVYAIDSLPSIGLIGEDYKESKIQEAKLNAVETSVLLVNKGPLSVVYTNIIDDSNSDNNGHYFALELALTYHDLKDYLANLKSLKNKPDEQEKAINRLSENEKAIQNNQVNNDSSFNKLIKTISEEGLLALWTPMKGLIKERFGSLSGSIGGTSIGFFRDEDEDKALKSIFDEKYNGKKREKSKPKIDVGLKFTIQSVFENGELNIQYQRASFLGSVDINGQTTRAGNIFVGVRAGFNMGIKYERNLWESPGTDTLSYISTLYNAHASAALNSESDKDRRDNAMTRIRLMELYLWEEKQDKKEKAKANIKNKEDLSKVNEIELLIKGKENQEIELFNYMNDLHWDSIGNDIEYTSQGWKDYKKKYESQIQEIANSFIHPLIEHKNDKDFVNAVNEGNLTMMTAGNAKKYFETPAKLLNPFEIDSDEDDVELIKFEKYVLFNLYKDQQKYDYEYDK
ncbi:LysM peptidoglycan-binding domain-containing protein [Flammeovirga sp. MY04]|uniref:LysM peptidoglycan-binding domain-containing protein n=1 Tax=Flammeovirga sp. MY04 TaxID=1191459 RepID=UPI00080629FA|nr:LysM domain-containing protein [Flammeovirga sp. MY04]ANQ52257.1 LysM peptidoglycan-binding domain-containing protein [Flammeovirga sp. MY04]